MRKWGCPWPKKNPVACARCACSSTKVGALWCCREAVWCHNYMIYKPAVLLRRSHIHRLNWGCNPLAAWTLITIHSTLVPTIGRVKTGQYQVSRCICAHPTGCLYIDRAQILLQPSGLNPERNQILLQPSGCFNTELNQIWYNRVVAWTLNLIRFCYNCRVA